MSAPRVRFAPSPTGYFHVGSGRTALFNWLFARHEGGVFVLRIEDTDAERNRLEYAEGIERAMRWLEMDWDEGPFFQSQRGELYQAAIDKLLAGGLAYACECAADEVQARAKARRGPPGYDGFCRDRGLEPTIGRVVRFRTPRDGTTTVVDLVRGTPDFANVTIEDFAVRKSSGQPLFLLANVVDDAGMAISHVIRGEDHLSNTPKYQLLWRALDYGPLPVFAHLPLLVNEKRQKLSKRRDKVALEAYRDEGYLPEAMRNYLALLGWAPEGDREFLALDELIAEFRLEDVKSAPAFFDEKKLQAVNATYIRALSSERFIERSQDWLRHRWAPIAPLVQERTRVLGDVPSLIDFLLVDEVVIDDKDWEKGVRQQPAFAAILDGTMTTFADCEWDAETLKGVVVQVGEQVGVPQLGKAQAPIRLSITGRLIGPPLFESLELLGSGPDPAPSAGRSGQAGGWGGAAGVTVRRLVGVVLAVVALIVVYLGVTFVQVWLASRRDQARPVQAIVVLGAAQYNGRPSAVLRARLDHAYDLWHEGLAKTVVVTGGREPGDRFTEATASANYLESKGVPDDEVLRETGGRNSWESLAASAAFLRLRGVRTVLLVSDPFHNERITLMADELGLRPYVSPTRTSPIHGAGRLPYFVKETVEVAIGRVIGFRHLTEWAGGLDSRMPAANIMTTRSGVV